MKNFAGHQVKHIRDKSTLKEKPEIYWFEVNRSGVERRLSMVLSKT